MRELILILLCVMLCGCGTTDEEVSYTPPVSEAFGICIVGPVSLSPIGSQSGMNVVDERTVRIYPYYDLDLYVTVTVLLRSENDWWGAVLEGCAGGIDLSTDDLELLSSPDGYTYAYKVVDEDYAIIVDSNTLPSGYVKLVAQNLCIYDT